MRRRARDTTALGVGAVVSGLLAYVFFVLSTRVLGPAAAAPVTVLWTYWSFAAAALTFPLQHWIAQSVAAHEGEGGVRGTLPRVAVTVTGASVAAGLLAWLARDSLFHRADAWFPLLVGCVTLGSGFIGVVRGGLSARRRFGSVAWALVAENALRCGAAGVLVLADVHDPLAYGICLAAGSFVGILWPSAVRFSPRQEVSSTGSPMRLLGGASGGQLVGQAVLTGGPVLLALGGGTAAQVTALFAGLALFRAPYTVAIGLVSQVTGRLTTLLVQGRHAELRRVRVLVVVSAAGSAVVAGLAAAAVGPGLLRLVFGAEVRLGGTQCALLAVGTALALANLVSTLMVLAQSRGGAVARSWLVGCVAGGTVLWLGPDEPLLRTCWTFVTAEGVAFAALITAEVRGAATASGSPRERGPAPAVRTRP